MYQHLVLSTHAPIGPPGPLPSEFTGLADQSLADLSWIGEPLNTDYAGTGFWPVTVITPAFDPQIETVMDALQPGVPDPATRTVTCERSKRGLTADELAARRQAQVEAINAERDRRIRAGFMFAGHPYDYDDDSQKRITGAASLAGFAIVMGGATAGNLRWDGGDKDFAWIAKDNAEVPMDAPTCFGLGQAAAAWEGACVFAGKAIKKRLAAGEVIPDITAAALWPN